jgi:hypothetical protein
VLDQAKAKGFLTAGQLVEATKTTSFYDVRVRNL